MPPTSNRCSASEQYHNQIFYNLFFQRLSNIQFLKDIKEKTMANTYSKIYIQTVFVVQDRNSLITKVWKDDLYKYICGIVQTREHKMLQIGGIADHVHLFVGLKPNESVSDLMKWVKGSSSEWINEQKFTATKFKWQDGFGAFSYSHSQISAVCKYIQNQETHHKKKTFTEEYLEFLEKFEVPFDERYLFNPVL
jgi:REP element-mobilizing transposase RayT